ncbi:MAG: hypothetical protein HC855_02540 [Rhizobiales bacterium]|nr:hypothetical protein [Hyphomicrobiales bacterium]
MAVFRFGTKEMQMAIKSKLANLVKRFAKAQEGSVAIVFGLSAFGVILAAGASIDYSRYVSARTHLQAALDAGALAAPRPVTENRTRSARRSASPPSTPTLPMGWGNNPALSPHSPSAATRLTPPRKAGSPPASSNSPVSTT